ncbi:MAG: hypothetical protein O7157_02680 [Wolbachia endosymbiont of Tetragnatha montana]|nr:hypothetical protein [Wolbachia endosymbiont of Tetragnatha montana]
MINVNDVIPAYDTGSPYDGVIQVADTICCKLTFTLWSCRYPKQIQKFSFNFK